MIRLFLENVVVTQLVREFPDVIEPKCSLLFTKAHS
jgi:hypothetical protein